MVIVRAARKHEQWLISDELLNLVVFYEVLTMRFSVQATSKNIIVLLLTSFSMSATAVTKLYVSPTGDDNNKGTESKPFKTIERARDEVRKKNKRMRDDINVYLRGGEYYLTDTITLDQRDSANNGKRIVYQAFEDETPVITAGKKITDWRPVMVNGQHVYKASVKGIDNFRELYVNGERAVRANSVNGVDLRANGIFSQKKDVYPYHADDYYYENGRKAGYILDKAMFGDDLRNSDHFELVYRVHWRQHRIAADQVVDRGDGKLIFKVDPTRMDWYMTMDFASAQPNTEAHFYVENAIALLDYPSEWYFDEDADTVYYYPKPSENMANAEVIIPNGVETLLAIQGKDLSNKVSGISFDGLTFEYSSWLRPFTLGTAIVQANFYVTEKGQGSHTDGKNGTAITNGAKQAQAAIDISFAEDIKIENSTIQHTGGTALRLYNAVNDVDILNNEIKDISETGILLGTWLHNFIDQNDEANVKNVLIRNNLLKELGRQYYSAPSIAAYYTDSLTIEHNHILHSSYGAINYGWNGWQGNKTQGISGEMDSITSRNTVIRYNHFEEFSEFMGDVGGTYSLGQQPNTEIYGNYYQNGNNYNGILYFDEGTAYVRAYHNVIDQRIMPDYQIRWHTAWNPSIHDYHVFDNYSNWSVINPNGTRALITINQTDIVSTTAHGTEVWPEVAQSIIDNAGRTDEPYVPAKVKTAGDVAFNSNARWLTKDNKLDNTTADFLAQYAVDGNPETAAKAGKDNALGTLEIDLLSAKVIDRVQLTFAESAHATEFKVLASLDGAGFKTLKSVSNAKEVSEISFTAGEYRYIRIVPSALNGTSMQIKTAAVFKAKKSVRLVSRPAFEGKPLQEGLTLWLNGDSADYAGNSRVFNWRDLAGEHNMQVPLAFANLDAFANGDTNTRKKPQLFARALNGRPVINFDGWDDSLTTEVTGSMTDHTLAYLAQSRNQAGIHILLDSKNFAPAVGQVTPGEWALWVISTKNGATKIYRNGEFLYQTALGGGRFSRLSISENRPIRDSGTHYGIYDGNLAEIMLYNQGLSEQQIQSLQRYVEHKYQLTTK